MKCIMYKVIIYICSPSEIIEFSFINLIPPTKPDMSYKIRINDVTLYDSYWTIQRH